MPDKEELTSTVVDAVNQALDDRKRIDEETHANHHQFLKVFIEKEERKQQTRDAIKKQVIGWGIISALSGVAIAAYNGFMHMVKGS